MSLHTSTNADEHQHLSSSDTVVTDNVNGMASAATVMFHLQGETERTLDDKSGESSLDRDVVEFKDDRDHDMINRERGQQSQGTTPPSSVASIPNAAEDLYASRLRLLSHTTQDQTKPPNVLPLMNDQLPDRQSFIPRAYPPMTLPGISHAPAWQSSPATSLHLSLSPQKLPTNLQMFAKPPTTQPLPQTPRLHESQYVTNPQSLLPGQPQLTQFTRNILSHGPQAHTAAHLQLASFLGTPALQANRGLYVQLPLNQAATLSMHPNLHIARHYGSQPYHSQDNEHAHRVEKLVSLLLSQHQQTPVNHASSTHLPISSNECLMLLRQLNPDSETYSRMTHTRIPSATASIVQPPLNYSFSNIPSDNAMANRRLGTFDALSSSSILQQGNHSTSPSIGPLGPMLLQPITDQLVCDSMRDQRFYTGHEPRVETYSLGIGQSKEKRWMIRYEELKQFQKKYGHCRVPHGYEENRKLSWWVMNQRAQYQMLKKGKPSWLTEDRVALLDLLGFDWNPIIGKTSKR